MYSILLLPVIAGLLAQSIKLFINSNEQKITYRSFIAYSGMPSGHAALVVALATIVGLEQGFSSPLFAVTLILAIIVIRDAVGIRRYLGQHGETLNALVRDLGEDKLLDKSYPYLLEKIGHTPLQVLVGGLIGFLVSFLGYLFI